MAALSRLHAKKRVIFEPPGTDQPYVPAIVTNSPDTIIYNSPHTTGQKIMLRVSAGTMLYATYYNHNWWRVLLLDGSYGYLHNDDCFSYDTLNKLSLAQLRNNIVTIARKFLNMPYALGGCSSFNMSSFPSQLTSVDCSSLVYLAYRINSILIPRDAHPQYRWGREVKPQGLQPGDLVFLVSPDTNRATHVLMYLGNENLIEANGQFSRSVVLTTFRKRLGRTKQDLYNGIVLSNIFYPHCRYDPPPDKSHAIYFRTYLD